MIASGVARGREVPRKTLHLTTASIPLFLWFGAPQRAVAMLLVGLFGVACVVELARRRSAVVAARFDATVGIMLRPHEVSHGITGATWLLATFAITCLAAPLPAVIAGTWAGAMGAAAFGAAVERRSSGAWHAPPRQHSVRGGWRGSRWHRQSALASLQPLPNDQHSRSTTTSG